jgi:hypothetical protein
MTITAEVGELAGRITELINQVKAGNEVVFDGRAKARRMAGGSSRRTHHAESIEVYVTRLEMKPFVLSSSYGMHGWILAKSVSKSLKQAGPSLTPSPPSP